MIIRSELLQKLLLLSFVVYFKSEFYIKIVEKEYNVPFIEWIVLNSSIEYYSDQ